jgi:hypothetical protein
MKHLLSILLLALLFGCSPRLEMPPLTVNLGFRGADVTENGDLFVAGQAGKVYFLPSGAQQWKDISPEGYDSTEFRDAYWNKKKQSFLVMGISSPGVLLEYSLKKENWTNVFRSSHPNIFMDGIAGNSERTFVYGDPLDSTWFLLSDDGNFEHWETQHLPLNPISGEAGFAASGSGLIVQKDQLILASGGKQSGLYIWNWEDSTKTQFSVFPYDTLSSSGVFSIAENPKTGAVVAVGGDYLRPNTRTNTAFIWQNGTIQASDSGAFGYRSSVIFHQQMAFCSGRNGVDISTDGGLHWLPFSDLPFYRLLSLHNGVLGIGKNGSIYLFENTTIEKFVSELE